MTKGLVCANLESRDGARLGDGTSPSGPPPPPCPPSTPAGPPRLGQDRGGRPAQGPAGLGPSAAPAAEALGGARGQRQQPKAPPGPRRGGGGGCLAGDLPGAGSGGVGRALAEASQRSRGGDAGTASCRQLWPAVWQCRAPAPRRGLEAISSAGGSWPLPPPLAVCRRRAAAPLVQAVRRVVARHTEPGR